MTGVIRQVSSEDGFVRGLAYPGLVATWLRSMTYVAFRIGLYPTVRSAVASSSEAPTLRDKIAAGATTGAVGSALFSPIDVVRLRMQADSGTVCRESGLLQTGLRKGPAIKQRHSLPSKGLRSLLPPVCLRAACIHVG